LNRICNELTGFNVKTVARIVRFQNFIRHYRSTSESSFSDAAYEAGFSDQAHMIREFRSFSGKTPSSVL
ncbi:MAG TPA: helix-turn-helix domain-containing protein, partial [Spirochaetota bacterium]|nr:helix-turn-helix domain-containing protein [Spirochaetota bacterium]